LTPPQTEDHGARAESKKRPRKERKREWKKKRGTAKKRGDTVGACSTTRRALFWPPIPSAALPLLACSRIIGSHFADNFCRNLGRLSFSEEFLHQRGSRPARAFSPGSESQVCITVTCQASLRVVSLLPGSWTPPQSLHNPPPPPLDCDSGHSWVLMV
jgi:hypothetical protein